MSALAGKLAEVEIPKVVEPPKTPCFPLYGYGDLEDLEAVTRLHESGVQWNQIQEMVDKSLGIEDPLPENKFIRHWRSKCSCWKSVR